MPALTDPKLKNVDAGSHSFIGRPDPVKPATVRGEFHRQAAAAASRKLLG